MSPSNTSVRHAICSLKEAAKSLWPALVAAEQTVAPYFQEIGMALESLHDLYVEELKDLYSAENQLVKALPKMAKAASAPRLRAAFEEHLKVTQRQVERLESIFDRLGVRPKGKRCKGMEGLIEEGKELIEEDAPDAVLDAGLIGAAQRVEHYEIAAYGTARTFAEMLGDKKAASLLQTTLDEEAAADKKLTQLAESAINVHAQEESENGEEEKAGKKKSRKAK